MLIAGIIRGFNGIVCLSYLLPVLVQPLQIVFATLVVWNAIATVTQAYSFVVQQKALL